MTTQVAEVPAPSTSTTCSPTRVRRTTTAWRASSPSTTTVVAGGDAGHRAEEDGERHGQRGLKASRSRPNTDLCGLWMCPSGDSSLRSAASSRSSSSCRSSSRPGRLDVDGDDDVAADLRAEVGYAATAEGLLDAGLGAGLDLEVDPQLHVGVGLGDVGLEQGQLDRRTERGRRHRHGDVAAQVGAVAGEHRRAARRGSRRRGHRPDRRRDRPRPRGRAGRGCRCRHPAGSSR